MKNKKKWPAESAETSLEHFRTMTRRIIRSKMARAEAEMGFNSASQDLARALVKANERCPTLMKNIGRPGIYDLHDVFYTEKLLAALKAHLPNPVNDLDHAKGARSIEKSSPWNEFNRMPYPTLHDSFIYEWQQNHDELRVLLRGSYDDSRRDDGDDKTWLELVFAKPKVELLVHGRKAILSEPEPILFKRGQGQTFAKTLSSTTTQRVDFDEIEWIHIDERSEAHEPANQWRWMISNQRQMEIRIEFDQLECSWGQRAIQARKESIEIERSTVQSSKKTTSPRM